MAVEASSPGKVILHGEYAVVFGKVSYSLINSNYLH
jgi:mevalonate kinase